MNKVVILLVLCIALGTEIEAMMRAKAYPEKAVCTASQLRDNWIRLDKWAKDSSKNFIFLITNCYVRYEQTGQYFAYTEGIGGRYNAKGNAECDRYIYKDDNGLLATSVQSITCPWR